MAKPSVCGYCLGAPLAADGTDLAHCRCPGTISTPSGPLDCACDLGGHALTAELAERMAGYCSITPELARYYHEHQRGDVVKVAAVEMLSTHFLADWA